MVENYHMGSSLSVGALLALLTKNFHPPTLSDEEIVPVSKGLRRVVTQDMIAKAPVPAKSRASKRGYVLYQGDSVGSPLVFHLQVERGIAEKNVQSYQGGESGDNQEGQQEKNVAAFVSEDMFFSEAYKSFVSEDSVSLQEGMLQVSGEDNLLKETFRKKGSDFNGGDLIVAKRTFLQSQDIVRLLTAGVGEVSVYRSLRIGMLSVGRALQEPGKLLEAGQYAFDYKRPFLLSLFDQLNFKTTDVGLSPLKKALLPPILDNLSYEHDVIICTVDRSDGEAMREISEILGIKFFEVNLFPGRRFSFCQVKDKPFLLIEEGGIGFWAQLHFILLPFLRYLAGMAAWQEERKLITAVKAGFSFEKEKEQDLSFLPVRLSRDSAPVPYAKPLYDFSFLKGEYLSVADGFVLLTEGRKSLSKGELISFFPFCSL